MSELTQTEINDRLTAKYGTALGSVMSGAAELDTLLDAYPDVLPHLPDGWEKLSEADRKTIAGYSVFLQVAGTPPMPKEDAPDAQ